jgi:hypothetical protein
MVEVSGKAAMKKKQVYKHKWREKSPNLYSEHDGNVTLQTSWNMFLHPFKCAYWIQSWNLISTPCININLSNIFPIEIGHKQNILPPLLF